MNDGRESLDEGSINDLATGEQQRLCRNEYMTMGRERTLRS